MASLLRREIPAVVHHCSLSGFLADGILNVYRLSRRKLDVIVKSTVPKFFQVSLGAYYFFQKDLLDFGTVLFTMTPSNMRRDSHIFKIPSAKILRKCCKRWTTAGISRRGKDAILATAFLKHFLEMCTCTRDGIVKLLYENAFQNPFYLF